VEYVDTLWLGEKRRLLKLLNFAARIIVFHVAKWCVMHVPRIECHYPSWALFTWFECVMCVNNPFKYATTPPTVAPPAAAAATVKTCLWLFQTPWFETEKSESPVKFVNLVACGGLRQMKSHFFGLGCTRFDCLKNLKECDKTCPLLC
jgi:hypothetical protein